MKVLKFEIENYKALAGRREIIPQGSNFFLVGSNAKGKTSAGRVLIDLLTKKNPSKPVTEGENEGYVEITFDDDSRLLAKYEDGKKPKLSFITSDGIKASTPKDFFEKMAGSGMTFNIDEFLKLSPKPKREMLEKIVGIDFTEINQKESDAMEEAKILRAKVRDQKAIAKPYDRNLAERKEIDVIELSEKIHKQKELARDIRREKDIVEGYETEIKQMEQKIAKLKTEIASKNKWIAEKQPEAVDEFEILLWQDELEKSDQTNKDIRQAKENKVQAELLRKVEKKLTEAENKVSDIRKEKEELIRSKPLPAEGLEFDPDSDGILLNGLPFEDAQIASSAKAIAGLQIAESQLGKIKYLHFSAESLDMDNAMKVLEWAEGRDLQLCIERPVWEGSELKMEIYDKTGEKIKEQVV